MRDRHEAEVELTQVDTVDDDRAVSRVVHAAQQLRQRRLARAVLADDGERTTGWNGQIKAVEHTMRTGRVVEPDCVEPDLVRGRAGGAT